MRFYTKIALLINLWRWMDIILQSAVFFYFCRGPINNEERIHSKFIYGHFGRINQGPSWKMTQRASIAPSWTIPFLVFCHFIQQEIIRCIKQNQNTKPPLNLTSFESVTNYVIKYQNDYNYFNAKDVFVFVKLF